MNFQAMREDGYSDTDIVESLRQSELFKGTADFDGLRKKGFDDTKIIDFLDATPSFHEAINAKRQAQPSSTPPQNNEGDVEGLGDTAVTTPPIAPTQEPKDDSFLGTIKSAGKALLEGLGFVSDIVTGDMGDAMMSAGQKVLKEKAKDMPEEKRASWNKGIDDLGTLNRNLNDPIDGLMSENTHYTSPAGTTKEQAVQIAKLYNPAEKSMTQGIKDWLFSEDNPNGITEEQVQERIQNVAHILNKPIDDIMIDTNPKSETYGVPYVKGANGEFLSTKSESVWENISTEMEADFPTILAQIGADKAGWDAGGVVGDKLSKFIPNKFLAAATRLGGRVVGSATSSTLATPAGTVVQKAQNAFETGVHEDADAYVSEAWRDMKDNFAATVAGGAAIEGVVAGAKGAKGAYTATKDYLTGDTRSYNMMLKDFGVDEQYAKDAITELNEMLHTPIEDSKQARMYAMALKHEKGLPILREALFRNTEAYQRVESEILNRTKQLKGLLEDRTINEGELDSFLKDASDEASAQYKAMRDILRSELANTPVTFDKAQVAKTIEDILVPKVIDEDAKKAVKNIVKLIKQAPYLTSNVDGLIELRHLINRRMRRGNVSGDFTVPDWEIVNGIMESIDATIYKTIDSAVSPEDAKVLKNIFESAKADYSAQKKAEASSFFASISKDTASVSDKVRAIRKGLKADSDAADFVLSRLTGEQRERLELTAIHETIVKNISGESGGVKAIRHEDVLKELEALGSNMTSQAAKDAIELIKKVNTVFAKDSSLILNVTEKAQNSLAMSLGGKLEFGLWQRMFEFVQRHTPTNKAARLQIYNRLGKYMETSHNTKELALKMYNDPLASAKDKLFWGKYIRYYNDGDNEGMAQLMQNPPEPPKGGGSGLMDESEIEALKSQGKEPTKEELKARLDEEVKSLKPDDTTPPDDNGGGGGSPKPKEGADNGVQGQKEALGRQSVEEIEASTGKTLDQLGDEDGFYTHYSAHEFDTLSATGAKDAGNLGQTKGKETNENNVINVTFGYKKGARVENEHGIGLAGQHEYKIDLRGREFFNQDKKIYFFQKVDELERKYDGLSQEELYAKAQEALGYDDATVATIVDFKNRYNAMRKANPNQTTKDTQNSVLKEMNFDGIQNQNHLEIFEDAPVYKVRTLEHDIDRAGMARSRSADNLPPVSGEGAGFAANPHGTIETTPSKSNPNAIDPFNKVLDKLSPQERIDFEAEHLPLVKQLAEDLGLSVDAQVSHGAFEGQTNPNIIVNFKEFYAKSRFADKQFKFKDEYGNLSVQAKEQIEAFLVAFGKATNQDSVGWYAPIFRGDQTGKHGYVEITKPLDIDQWNMLYNNLRGEWGEIVPVMHKGRIDFMNWNGLPDAQFKEIVSNATKELEQSGIIGNKIVQFDTADNLISKDDYGVYSSESRRPNLPTGGNRSWDDATQRFEQGVEELRRRLQERPKLDGGQKEVQDPIGTTRGINKEEQPLRVTQQQAGEQLASDLKDAPASTFKGGYVRPEVLSFMTKTLTGAMGGSLTEYDYNKDGKIDFKDRAIGAALGVVGFHALTSKPAFSAYKALAEHSIKQLEQRAEQGDIIAQMALGTRYIYASGKAGEKGAFSDIATKAVMKEIDDSGAKISFTYDTIPSTDRHILKQFEHYKNGELSQSDFEFYVSQRMNKELDALFNKRKNGELDSFDYYKQRKSIEDKYFDIKVGNKTSGKLEDFLHHDALYKEYPFLKDIDVSVKRISSSGYFDPVKKEIVIDSASKDKDTTLLHEIQHAIQTKEGWARGSSVGNGDFEFLLDDISKIGAEMKHLEEIASNARKNGIDPFTNKEFAERYFSTDAKLQSTREEAKKARHEGRTGFNDYMRHWGEQQARATEYRKDMTPEQRAKESWQETLKREEGKYDEPIIRYGDGEMMSVKYDAPFEDKLNDIRTFFKDNVDKKTLKADEKELYEFVMGNQNFVDFFTENIRTVLPKGNDSKGFKHFIIRHYGEGAESELSAWDVLRIGKTIMNGAKLTDAEISKNIEKLGHAKDAFRRSVTTKDGDYVYVVGVEGDKRNGDNIVITYYKTKIGDLGDNSKPPVGKQA